MAFQDRYETHCSIVPVISGNPVNRTLATMHQFNAWLEIPPFHQMIQEMK